MYEKMRNGYKIVGGNLEYKLEERTRYRWRDNI